MPDTLGSTRGRPAMAQLAMLAKGSRPGSVAPQAWQRTQAVAASRVHYSPRAGHCIRPPQQQQHNEAADARRPGHT